MHNANLIISSVLLPGTTKTPLALGIELFLHSEWGCQVWAGDVLGVREMMPPFHVLQLVDGFFISLLLPYSYSLAEHL